MKKSERRVYATNIPRSNDGENIIPKEYIFHVEFFFVCILILCVIFFVVTKVSPIS